MNEKELLKKISELESELKKIKKQKKYGLVWEEKPEQIVEDCKHNVPILRLKEKKKGIDPVIITDSTKDENILIEGDNYHALSVLNYTHKGKIDVIYIDPPYNTGARDWKYNNDYVDNNDQWRHSKWISFMNNRLWLAKNLLSKKGVLVCAIDHNELFTLGLLFSEIFPDKEITCVTVVHNPSGIQGKNFSHNNEYLLFVYDDSEKVINFEERDDENADVRLFMNTAKGKGDNYKRITGYNSFYPIYIKNNMVIGFGDICKKDFHPPSSNIINDDGILEVYPIDNDGTERKWVFSRDSVEQIINELSVKQNKNGKYEIIRTKKNINYKTVWIDKKFNAKTFGTQLLTDMLDNNDFSFPKSLQGVIETLNVISHKKDSIFLDFFAGSGTTGHAVLELNKKDNGDRKFILCTNNEVGEEKEKEFKYIYKINEEELEIWKKEKRKEWINWCDNFGIASSITYERIKRTINGYKNKKGEKIDGIGGNLRYYKTDLVNIERLHNAPDQAKIDLTYQAGEMIGLKENTLNEIEKNDWWQIFKGNGKITAIYFKEDKEKLLKLVEILEKEKQPTALYIFSWGKNEYKSEYSSSNIRVEDIPEPILEVYKEINHL